MDSETRQELDKINTKIHRLSKFPDPHGVVAYEAVKALLLTLARTRRLNEADLDLFENALLERTTGPYGKLATDLVDIVANNIGHTAPAKSMPD